MPTQTHGLFHWNELMTWNVEKAKAFYAETLGWTYDSFPMEAGGVYTVCKADGEMAGGMMELTPGTGFDGIPDHWYAYITVDDVDARAAKIEAAGGEIVHGPFDVAEVGRIVLVKDTTGAQVGWITPTP